MNNVKISVTDNIATLTSAPTLTAGMVGLTCELTLSSYWSDMDTVIATVKGSGEHLDCDLTAPVSPSTAYTFVVPWECLADELDLLSIGVYGYTEDGDVKTPTIWCRVGIIERSALPSLESGTAASQTVISRLEAAIAEKGTYSKPSTGIPATDLAAAVQTSLGLADTALQSHQSLAAYRTSAAQDIIDATKLGDAPSDGSKYVRKDGAWVTGGGGGAESFDDLTNRPTYAGSTMSSATAIPEVKASEWDAKYDKPSAGIPSTDMTAAVQASLALADTALQAHQSLSAYRTSAAQDTIDSGKEDSTNKVTTVSASSTDTQYPTAKCVYDLVGDIETLLAALL